MNIPLTFWFNKDHHLSIPTCALPYAIGPNLLYVDEHENNVYDVRVLYGDDPVTSEDMNLTGSMLFERHNTRERELHPGMRININFDWKKLGPMVEN
jgi:hypothetical protein